MDGAFGLSHAVQRHAAAGVDGEDEQRAGLAAKALDADVLGTDLDAVAPARPQALPARCRTERREHVDALAARLTRHAADVSATRTCCRTARARAGTARALERQGI
jgi:hypothetical protein